MSEVCNFRSWRSLVLAGDRWIAALERAGVPDPLPADHRHVGRRGQLSGGPLPGGFRSGGFDVGVPGGLRLRRLSGRGQDSRLPAQRHFRRALLHSPAQGAPPPSPAPPGGEKAGVGG